MRVFEFHFRPANNENNLFDTFCFDPENIYEKRLGNLYLAGLIKNNPPQDSRFLDNLANVIKAKFYAFSAKSAEQSIRESLRQANGFLDGLVKNGDVGWLGNLNFAVLSLQENQLNFTKVGNLQILLLRKGEVFDIGKDLDFQEIEPYPLKVFSNIVSGDLMEDDKVLIANQEVFNFITSNPKNQKPGESAQSILAEINDCKSLSEKNLKEIFKKREAEIKEVAGLCLILDLEESADQKQQRPIILKEDAEEFSIQKIFAQSFAGIKNSIGGIPKFFTGSLSKLPKFPHFQIPKLGFNFNLPIHRISDQPGEVKKKIRIKVSDGSEGLKNLAKSSNFKKNSLLIGAFIFCLLLGFFLFRAEGNKKLKDYQASLNGIQERLSVAQGSIGSDPKKSYTLLVDARKDILLLLREENSLKNKAVELKDSIEGGLLQLSNYEDIADPELFFEFDSKEFIPQKMIALGNNIYFYNPYSYNIFKLNSQGEKSILQTDQKFSAATYLGSSLLFFREPDTLFLLRNDALDTSYVLKAPYQDFDFDNLVSFQYSAYLLDSKKGEIVKYPNPISSGKDLPQVWLGKNTKRVKSAESIAIDGSVWILSSANSIDRFYGGVYQETLKIDFFPFPKDFTKIYIWPALPYLYVLEPAQNRLIVLDKTGQVAKQFHSEKFDALMDFAPSPDGRTIYLLNGSKLYKIPF